MADTLRMLSRNWFPSPAPSLAPRTSPAARAQSLTRAPRLRPAARRTDVYKFKLRSHHLKPAEDGHVTGVRDRWRWPVHARAAWLTRSLPAMRAKVSRRSSLTATLAELGWMVQKG